MRAPDKAGVARAWRIEKTPELVEAHVREWGYADGGIGPTWIVNGPYHPFWSWWHIGCITLREIAGAPASHREYPEAEFEIGCWSLNPAANPPRPAAPDIDKLDAGDIEGGLPGFLTPQDWRVHFHGVTDEQAAQICEHAVDAIVAGRSCDSDFRTWWKGAITKTVEHFVLGVHE